MTHPKVADAAVFGVPNADLGEEVKAVVQPVPGVHPGAELAEDLIAFCRDHLAHLRARLISRRNCRACRLGNYTSGKLRERYGPGHASRIV